MNMANKSFSVEQFMPLPPPNPPLPRFLFAKAKGNPSPQDPGSVLKEYSWVATWIGFGLAVAAIVAVK